jgi:putative glutamine amidotransferase
MQPVRMGLMTRPIIGMTCYQEDAKWGAWDINAAVLPHWYLDLFQSAGATVLLIPQDPNPDTSLLDRLDGLVIVGGADVDSRLYNEAPHETADRPREARDASDLAWYRGARERNMPVLGICRGLQVMAVAHGGALHQDMPEVSELVHRERPGHFTNHRARCVPGTKAARIFGDEEFEVNSSHHQGVKDAGDLLISIHAEDGTVEGCEDPTAEFAVGVQWHPEHPDRRMGDAQLVEAFLDVARGRAPSNR